MNHIQRFVIAIAVLLASITPLAWAQAIQQALLGAWQCQTPQGPASVNFGPQGDLTYNGDVTEYIVQGNVITALVDGFPRQYRYQLAGNTLAIANPDGSRTSCQRGGAPAQQAGGAMNAALQGTMCGHSGSRSSTGSYSSTTRVSFDGRGRFATGSESSFSVQSGLGYGSNSGEGGSYTVTAVRVGAPIPVRWNNGESDQAVVNFVSGGRITEIRYGKQVLGHALCGY